MKTTAAILLSCTLASGCATVRDSHTGQQRTELTNTGKIVVGLLVGGALLAAASALSDDGPTRTYKTSCDTGGCVTKVYE